MGEYLYYKTNKTKLASFLDKVLDSKTGKMIDRGVYDPTKRYGFKNITEKPFTFSWDNNPITVPPGEEIELPEYMAIMATHKQVDQIMSEIAFEDTVRLRKENKDYAARSPLGIAMGVPSARKPYEDKILRELKLDEKNPQVQILRAQIKEQLMTDLTNGQKPAAPIESVVAGIAQFGNPTAPKEFSEIS